MITAHHDAPCWEVVHADGAMFEYGDYIRHFTTEADAASSAEDWTADRQEDADEGETVEPLQATLHAPTPCLIAVCDGPSCGYRYDEDGEGLSHFDSVADATSCITDSDWIVTDDGQTLCSEHACEVVGHNWHRVWARPEEERCRRCYALRDAPQESTASEAASDA